MKYTYKTIAISDKNNREELNSHYEKGWEFVDATANYVSASSSGGGGQDIRLVGTVYFTIRKLSE